MGCEWSPRIRFISRPWTSTSIPQLREHRMQAVWIQWLVVAMELMRVLLMNSRRGAGLETSSPKETSDDLGEWFRYANAESDATRSQPQSAFGSDTTSLRAAANPQACRDAL